MVDLSQELISQSTRGRPEADLLKGLLNFDSLIFEIEQALRNKSYNPQKQEWEKRGKALVNELGLTTLRGIITSHLNNVFIVSNFNDDDVSNICQFLGEDIIKLLSLNYIDWEIDERHLGIIYTIIINNVYAMLKGSFDEGIREMLKQVEKRETRIIQEPRNKRSLIPSLGGRDNE